MPVRKRTQATPSRGSDGENLVGSLLTGIWEGERPGLLTVGGHRDYQSQFEEVAAGSTSASPSKRLSVVSGLNKLGPDNGGVE